MNVTSYGAAHQVTGSCHLLETSKKRILVDCGMFQGSNYNESRNFDDFEFDPKTIDAVVVTHGHLDHTGRIPKLLKDGFKGNSYVTHATGEISKIIWDDAYKIMTYNNRKFKLPIMYTPEDIAAAAAACVGVEYGNVVDLGDGVTAIFKDAGHIFGSSFIEITADGKTVAFSGDIGNEDAPILKDTAQLGHIDVLFCESTYGGRTHETRHEADGLLLDLIKEGVERGGTIMMPTFSIERTQEILYGLDRWCDEGKLPRFPIYVDSPMAIRAIPVYKKYPEYYDAEACKQYMSGDDFLDFPGLTLTLDTADSKKINNVPAPKMIIAGSGMMTGGRILHHAMRYLPDPKSTLIIVGYQAHGTIGRRLYEGSEKVKIYGKEVEVRATIKAIGGLSAHGDKNKLMDWIDNAEKKPEKIYFIHGEPESATDLAHTVKEKLGIKTFVPEEGEKNEL